jgi:hypothetical protein
LRLRLRLGLRAEVGLGLRGAGLRLRAEAGLGLRGAGLRLRARLRAERARLRSAERARLRLGGRLADEQQARERKRAKEARAERSGNGSFHERTHRPSFAGPG